MRITLTKRVAVHTSVPYVKFGKKNGFVLPDFDVAFKVNLKSSIITRYFLTRIGHLLDVEITIKVDLKNAFSKY